ncbi:MAG TPA: DoxX family protein [Cyclobacteriaceae bacterium]
MTNKTNLTALLLRFALAATYVSAYSSRINLFGGHPDGWERFLKYASDVNSYAPESIKTFLAITATVLEISISILLVIGFQTRKIAVASGVLTLFFALAMTYSFGIKEPLDYGVFVNFTAAFLLATIPVHIFSVDQLIVKRDQSKKM